MEELLAFYIYPLPKGTEYTKEQLNDENKVEELFDYAQILEACITKKGWEYLINVYGYETLFKIDIKSGWHDAEDIKDFISYVEMEKKMHLIKFRILDKFKFV